MPAPAQTTTARRADGSLRRWRWYHGVAFYLLVQLLTFGLSGLTSALRGTTGKSARERVFGDVSYFRSLKQSVFAPPSWAFGPAWTINNTSAIWGALRVLNTPPGTPGRDEYVALQAATWLTFVLFNAAYFSLRSPLNALVLTVSFFALTLASMLVALLRLKDSRVALSLATTILWLLIAAMAATFQALWNCDEFYGVGPFMEPNRALLKDAR
jgi:tryptophan-rich sensory protein